MTSDAIARVQRLAAVSRERTDGAAARNRARFPEHARVLDEFRSVFGPGCRWVYLYDEQGSVGKPGPAGVVASAGMPVREAKRGKR